jgi:5-formyltetrahydrofolate cyclo-ligase
MSDAKGELRRHMLERRDLVSHAEAHDASAAITHRALDLLQRLFGAERPAVSVFWPIRSEINTRPLIDALHVEGYAVALPRMSGVKQPLHFHAFAPGDDLAKGPFGLSEPMEDKPTRIPRLLFAPLAAFDRKGFRLGYGGGIYDATLSGLRAQGRAYAVGLAYALQEASAIPTEPHDQKLDFVLTERETIDC